MLTRVPDGKLTEAWKAGRRGKSGSALDLEGLTARMSHRREVRTLRREVKDWRRVENARAALAGFDGRGEVFGFTKGQFSLIQVLGLLLETSGRAHVSIATWTAAQYDIGEVSRLKEGGLISGARWLLDLQFQRRAPDACARLRELFGEGAIRIGLNHAKFLLIEGVRGCISVLTSMNLNTNPRFEYFMVSADRELGQFLRAVLDDMWRVFPEPEQMQRWRPGLVVQRFKQAV